MKQKKNFIINIIVIPILVGLIVNFVYDKIKNHSMAKSGFEFELHIKFKQD